MLKTIITTVLVITILCVSNTQPGSLDLTFGDNGIVDHAASDLLLENETEGFGDEMVVQSFNRILWLSTIYEEHGDSTVKLLRMIRHSADGQLDLDFGNKGFVRTSLDYNVGLARAEVQPDDGVLLAMGDIPGENDTARILVYRFLPDGELDSQFADLGVIRNGYIRGPRNTISPLIHSVFYAPISDRIYVMCDSLHHARILRYFGDGTLDSAFADHGILRNGFSWTSGLLEQPDGKVIYAGNPDTLTVRRINVDGSPDMAFGDTGTVLLPIGTYVPTTSLQADGKILVGGWLLPKVNKADMAVMRLNPDGSIDRDFGDDGMVSYIRPGIHDYPGEMAVLSDGSIVILTAGSALLKYLQNGDPDISFGEAGVVNLESLYEGFDAGGMAVTDDESILIGGIAEDESDMQHKVLMKLLSGVSTGSRDKDWPLNVVTAVYPNPFHDILCVEYDLTARGRISVELYNAAGQKMISLLSNAPRPSGRHIENFRLNDQLPAGQYFLTISMNGYTAGKSHAIVRL